MPKNVRSVNSLNQLPSGARVQVSSKKGYIRYFKRADGVWSEPTSTSRKPVVKTADELAEEIAKATEGGFAQVLR